MRFPSGKTFTAREGMLYFGRYLIGEGAVGKPRTTTLEDFLEFVAPNAIRIKGHRIGIETIVLEHLNGLTPIEIVIEHPTLSLVEVEAVLEYYRLHKDDVTKYLKLLDEEEEMLRRNQELNPSPAVLHLRELHRAKNRERGLGPSTSTRR